MAIWVPSVTNQAKESDTPDKRTLAKGYSSISHAEDNDGNGLELSIVGDAANLEEIDEELLLDNLKVEKSFFVFPSDHLHNPSFAVDSAAGF